MLDYFTRQRALFSKVLSQSPLYWKISPQTYSRYIQMMKILPSIVSGQVLDAGAGNLTSKVLLKQFAGKYESMDITRHCEEIDFLGDIQDMNFIPDGKYDVVYSSQVLEHVPRPWDAVDEIFRIVKPGGCAIITVPHLSALHEEPHDYYRYTPYSLNFLLSSAGFNNVRVYKMGGLLSFIIHPFCMFFVLLFWRLPVIKWVVFWINFVVLVFPSMMIDRLFGLEKKYPANIMVIGSKDAV